MKKKKQGRKKGVKGVNIHVVFLKDQIAFLDRCQRNNPLNASSRSAVVRHAVAHYQKHIEGNL